MSGWSGTQDHRGLRRLTLPRAELLTIFALNAGVESVPLRAGTDTRSWGG